MNKMKKYILFSDQEIDYFSKKMFFLHYSLVNIVLVKGNVVKRRCLNDDCAFWSSTLYPYWSFSGDAHVTVHLLRCTVLVIRIL